MLSRGVQMGSFLVGGLLSVSLLCGAIADPPDFYDVAAVSSAPDRLDVVAVSTDGHVYYATWEPGSANWQGWWQVGSDSPIFFFSAGVSLVSRSRGWLDAFAVGEDGHVYTASKGLGAAPWDWGGWSQIGDLTAAYGGGTRVTAVSRSDNKLDIFTIGSDGYVYTASWEPGLPSWRGWSRIGNLRADVSHTLWQPGEIVAVSRSRDTLDVFAVGADRRVHSASWEQSATSWQGWSQIGDLSVPGDADVTAVSRRPDRIDIFVAPGAAGDSRGCAYTAGWERGYSDWSSWSQIGTSWVRGVRAISRSDDRIDIFAAERSYDHLVAATWEQGIGIWRDWSELNGSNLRSAVCAVSRSTGKVDLFFIGGDRDVYTLAWEPGKEWGDLRRVQQL